MSVEPISGLKHRSRGVRTYGAAEDSAADEETPSDDGSLRWDDASETDTGRLGVGRESVAFLFSKHERGSSISQHEPSATRLSQPGGKAAP